MFALSRLPLGFGESLIGTGSIAWAIGRSGVNQTASVISWNGIATYGGLEAEAQVGVWLTEIADMGAADAMLLAIGLGGLAFALTQPCSPPIRAEHLDFFGGRQSARSIHFICASLLAVWHCA